MYSRCDDAAAFWNTSIILFRHCGYRNIMSYACVEMRLMTFPLFIFPARPVGSRGGPVSHFCTLVPVSRMRRMVWVFFDFYIDYINM